MFMCIINKEKQKEKKETETVTTVHYQKNTDSESFPQARCIFFLRQLFVL